MPTETLFIIMAFFFAVSVVFFGLYVRVQAKSFSGLLRNSEGQANLLIQVLSLLKSISTDVTKVEGHLKDQDTVIKVVTHDLQQIKTRLTASKKREKKLLKKGKRGRS